MSSVILINRFPKTLTNLINHPLPHIGRASVPFFQKQSITTSNTDARKGDRERVVILGSGWAGTYIAFRIGDIPVRQLTANPYIITGFVLSRQLSAKKYQALVISPRSYFVFTPLLAGTAVGTLEFRTTVEPVRNRRYPNVEFIQAWADDVDFDKKIVRVEGSIVNVEQSAAMGDRYRDHTHKEGKQEKSVKRRQGEFFNVAYDKLVVGVGCYNQTFKTKGVKENAFFLKDVADARKIRKRILGCYEIAALPTTSDQLKRQLPFCSGGRWTSGYGVQRRAE